LSSADHSEWRDTKQRRLQTNEPCQRAVVQSLPNGLVFKTLTSADTRQTKTHTHTHELTETCGSSHHMNAQMEDGWKQSISTSDWQVSITVAMVAEDIGDGSELRGQQHRCLP